MPVTNRDVNHPVHDPDYPEVSGVLESVGASTAVVRTEDGELIYPVAEDLQRIPQKDVQAPAPEGTVEPSANGKAQSSDAPSRA
jgi:hypothetical protein